MRPIVPLLAFTLVAPCPAVCQSLEGVWKPVEVVVDSGPDRGRHTADVQPGLLIFTKKHYSVNTVQGFKARPIPSANATDEQLGLSFLSYTANAGTYQRKGSTLTFSPSVAKNPAVMAGKPLIMTARTKGDTLWSTAPLRGSTATWTWVRIER
ncbi:MAG TPA: hypothetical protein VIG78_07940 [Gemmatimonadaceae bacterium]|jgi:hypothetical protein